MEKSKLEKLKKRSSGKYSVSGVNFGSNLENETKNYLINQNYLDFESIIKTIKIKFNKSYPFGYILKFENEIVGFLGTIFSDRIINNKNYTYCNLHTWIVNKSHRLNSYLLLLPVLEKKVCIMTFTPVKSLIGLYQKFDFNKIQMKYNINFISGFNNIFSKNNLEIDLKTNSMQNKLKENDLKILKDHHNSEFIKFFVFDKKNSSNYSLVVSSLVKKKFFNVLNILYVSNISFFKNNWRQIRHLISQKLNISFCGQYYLSKNRSIFPPNKFFSVNLNREICVKDLPNDMNFNILYSEII